jgi:hypothetical protein
LAAICLAAFGVAKVSRAIDVLWQGADGANWSVPANWNNTNSGGVPVRDFAEVAIINNNTTAVVTTNQTGMAGTAGLVLGTAAADIGRLTIQNGGSLTSEAADIELGSANIGVAGKGTLTVLGGGNLTTGPLTVAGSTAGGTQSELTLGDTSGLTATFTVKGTTSLNRTTRIVGPNVNFTTQGIVSLATSGTIVADIRHATNHSAIKSTQIAHVGGTLRPQFTGVSPAVGNAWTIVDAPQITGNFTTVDATAAPALGTAQRYTTRIVNGGSGKQLQLVAEQFLTLQVNRETGAVTIRNAGPAVAAASVSIDGYSVISGNGSLNTTNARWNSLTDQAAAGWLEGNSGANSLNELNMSGSVAIAGNSNRALGTPYTATFPAFGTDPDDISFQYSTANGLRTGFVEYTGAKANNNLIITVNPATGQAQLKNDSPFTIQLEGYSVFSPSGALKPANGQWSSLTDQATPGWVEASPTSTVLSELKAVGTLSLAGGGSFNLGTPFTAGGSQDLRLEFLLAGEANPRNGAVIYGSIPTPGFAADFDHDGDVDNLDQTAWKGAFGVNTNGNADGDTDSDGNDFLIWQRQLGSHAATGAAGAVPEPAAFGLALLGLVATASVRWRRRSGDQNSVETCTCKRSSLMRPLRRPVSRGGCLAAAACAAWIGLAPAARAVNIAWVSLHNPDGSASAAASADPFNFTMAPDIGYTNALTAAGHSVTRFTAVDNIQNSTLAASLNAPGIDLVILGRSLDSGYLQTDAETLVWNSVVAKPMIVMSAFVARGARLGLTRNIDDNTPDAPTTPVKLEALVPSHPIFNGVALDGSNVMVNNYNLDVTAIQQVAGVTQRSFNTVMHPLNGGGQILARIATPGATQNGLVIGVTPAGSTVQNVNDDGDDVLGAARMVFYSGTREHAAVTTPVAIPTSTNVSGIYDLDADGKKLFLNAVTYMAGTSVLKPGDVNGDGLVDVADFNVIKNNFRTTVTMRSSGDLTGDGFVDLADFRQWKDYDPLFATEAGVSIPEPSAVWLALTGIVAMWGRRRRRVFAVAPIAAAPAANSARTRRAVCPRYWSIVLVVAAVWSCLGTMTAQAVNIGWVSFHAGDAAPSAGVAALGITEAPDKGYTDILAAAGHTVTRVVGVENAQNVAGLQAQLNGFDVVIISRSIGSGNFDSDGETAFWNGLTKPQMILSGYLTRNVRLGFTSGGTIPDTAGAIKLTAANPAHPIFKGIPLDGANQMVNDFTSGLPIFNGAEQRGISINTDPLTGGGTLIARDSTPGDAGNSGTGMVIAEWAAGASVPNTSGTAGSDILGNKRLAFFTGGRETNGVTSESAGVFDLTPNGQQMFLNAVNYLGLKAGDVDSDGDVDMVDFDAIKNHFQQSATLRSQGDLDGDGVVGFKDFRAWKNTFPFPVSDNLLGVPEPATAGLGLMALVVLGVARRTSRSRD